MTWISDWTRRRFLSQGAATAFLLANRPALVGQKPQSAASSPEEIAGAVRGLMLGQTARPMRYQPANGGFTIRNGPEFFNRPLYGPNVAFRVDAGDLPEFSLYLPGHGGNLRLGFTTDRAAKWLHDAEQVTATYRAGRMIYQIRDQALGSGEITVEALTSGQSSGLHVRVVAGAGVAPCKLTWAFAGLSGRKGKRGGDIGCETEPVTRFFQVRPEECEGNVYTIDGASATLHAKPADLAILCPEHATLSLGDATDWNRGWPALAQSATVNPALPALLGSAALLPNAPLHLRVRRIESGQTAKPGEPGAAYRQRTAELDALAARLQVSTPDEIVDTAAAAFAVAADALWDDAQRCVMHGAVAWRNPLAGWRGPYVLDALGWHERFREHARHWIAKQNTSPVTTATPALGGPDPGSHLTRSEAMLHSRGDLSHNHYDMNLVFFDAVLRHLRWTGDMALAAEIWPALEMHLAWEQRLFRRLYGDLPLYEGYACIWASDNLQYNGGGATHSTAYNLFANRMAADLARLLGKDAAPYEREATLIQTSMRKLLWLPAQGTFGESKDLLGPQTVYTSPALWTVYHAIDSEAVDPREAWQMGVERLAALRSVPVSGDGVPEGGVMLSCSDWMPYDWSLNLLLMAENMHMALALWQAGMAEEAYRLFKGNLLDSMFQGLCPGNFHMTSPLDAHRQEAQRDFGDPIGIASRALVEGLFGLRPDHLRNVLTIAPGFPAAWDRASLRHPDFDLLWHRDGTHETCEITSRLGRPLALHLRLRAPSTGQPTVRINGETASARFDETAIGAPVLEIQAPPAMHWTVALAWHGALAETRPAHRVLHLNDRVIPTGITVQDPQGSLRDGRAVLGGTHTVFTPAGEPGCLWWMPHSFDVLAPAAPPPFIDAQTARPIDLQALFTHPVTAIFERTYDAPRSPFCSLSVPQQGIGAWAAFDRQPKIDDRGLRALGGELRLPFGIHFRTPSATGVANCVFLSHWAQDKPTLRVPLTGSARSLSLLLAGTTFPQCSRMDHAIVEVFYSDGTSTQLALRNPENWWPIEQDYLIDDFLFVDQAEPPVRVDLQTGKVRTLDPHRFRGLGRNVPGGAATVVAVALDPAKTLAAFEIRVQLYGVVVGVLAATLG